MNADPVLSMEEFYEIWEWKTNLKLPPFILFHLVFGHFGRPFGDEVGKFLPQNFAICLWSGEACFPASGNSFGVCFLKLRNEYLSLVSVVRAKLGAGQQLI